MTGPRYQWGARSVARLATVHSALRELFERVIARPDLPHDLTVLCGHRGEAEQAARNLGFAYTTRLGGVLDLRSGEWTRSQSLVYSPRSAWRRNVSLAWNAFLAARLRKNPLARLGLHPPDWRYDKIRIQALRLAREASTDRKVIRYRDWVGA